MSAKPLGARLMPMHESIIPASEAEYGILELLAFALSQCNDFVQSGVDYRTTDKIIPL
jgi:hypothetical protein